MFSLFSLCLGFTPPTLLIFFSCKTFLGRRPYGYNDHAVFFFFLNGCGLQYVKKRWPSPRPLCGKGTFWRRCSLCLLFPCQSARDQIFMFPCWTPNPPSSVAFSSAGLWRHSPCCTAPLPVSLSLHAVSVTWPFLFPRCSVSLFGPLSCSPWLITASAMPKLKVSLTDCQRNSRWYKFLLRLSRQRLCVSCDWCIAKTTLMLIALVHSKTSMKGPVLQRGLLTVLCFSNLSASC